MNKVKSNGDKTLPCETPADVMHQKDKYSPRRTRCLCPNQVTLKSINHCRKYTDSAQNAQDNVEIYTIKSIPKFQYGKNREISVSHAMPDIVYNID